MQCSTQPPPEVHWWLGWLGRRSPASPWRMEVTLYPLWHGAQTILMHTYFIPPQHGCGRYGPATRAIRAGHARTEEGEHGEAIFTTSSGVTTTASQAPASPPARRDLAALAAENARVYALLPVWT